MGNVKWTRHWVIRAYPCVSLPSFYVYDEAGVTNGREAAKEFESREAAESYAVFLKLTTWATWRLEAEMYEMGDPSSEV